MFLKDRLRAPGSILNYFSSVKIWVTAGPGDSSAFLAHEIATLKRGLSKNSPHVATQAPAITPSDFKAIIDFLYGLSPRPLVLIMALLIGYYTMVRQSNFVMTSNTPGQCPHLLKFKDVSLTPDALFVTIRSTKTRSSVAIPVIFRLPLVPSSSCCPVTAWTHYVSTCNPLPDSPALLLPTGSPLSARTLLRALTLVSWSVFGVDKRFTLHSLRRGATQACQGTGLSLEHIMSAGMWKSQAVKSYLQHVHVSSAPAALGQLLG